MRAAVVHGTEQAPVYGEFEEPAARDGFEIVQVAASALSNATRARAAGSHYSATGGFPLVPGVDGVGRTADGRRVGFLLPEAPFGGMGERTLVRTALCLPVPDDVSDTLAAAIINPGQSPIGALRGRAAMEAGESVLINGATGTTGQVAVQVARHLGASRVVATGRDPVALARLRQLGADDTIDLTLDAADVRDAVEAHVAHAGIDIVLDYLSGPPTETVLTAIARGHKTAKPIRYVLAGASAGAATTVPTSALGAAPLLLMGSGISAARLPEIVRSAAEALDMVVAADLKVDLVEVPLTEVGTAWTADYGRRRVVFALPAAGT